ncbi:MAG: DUF4147 domain-containing protein [Pseudomonadota bacterium]
MNLTEKRAAARAVFEAGVAAADPFAGVDAAIKAQPVEPGTPIIAVGKAALRMAEAALAHVEKPSETIIVTNPENARELSGARVFASAHPVPDTVGLEAAEAVAAALSRASAGALVLVSGGGSALLPAPVKGLSLQDKIEVNELLLASGANIVEMNLVRQKLSSLKGGGMLRVAAGRVRALILSDVIGDDLRAIASGPTAAPLGTKADAKAMLERYGIWDRVPAAARAHLETAETDATLPEADNLIVGSNTVSVMAMAAKAKEYDLPLHIHAPALTGDVEDAARRVAGCTDPGIHLFGGETTVQLKGAGKGGRNQELALRAALHLERDRSEWHYLQAGTDGRDGPTDAAGGVVDAGVLSAMRSKVNVEALLADNDAYPALKSGSGLLMTGGTGTNVADLGVLIR